MQQAEDRLGSSAPNLIVVAFGSQFGSCPDAGWMVASAFLLRFCLHYFFLPRVHRGWHCIAKNHLAVFAMCTPVLYLATAELVSPGAIGRDTACALSCI